MKSLFLSFYLILLISPAFSQKTELYVKGGLNLANISTINKSNFDDVSTISSFHAGVMAGIPLTTNVALQPALLFSGKGSKMSYGSSTDANFFEATATPFYLELPVNLITYIPMPDIRLNFFVGGGLYGAVALGGRNYGSMNESGTPSSFDDEIEFKENASSSSDDNTRAGLPYMKAFDAGFNSTAGLTAGKWFFSLSYSYGFFEVAREKTTDDKNRNRVFNISIGFKIL